MFDLFAELSGLTAELREVRMAFVRIAEALERISPPLRGAPVDAAQPASEQGRGIEEELKFSMSESPEEWQERRNSDAALAASLNVAPWSPAFERLVAEMKSDLLQDGHNEEEADGIVRDAFQLAKAQANELTGAATEGERTRASARS
jgi:hypothetical protein